VVAGIAGHERAYRDQSGEIRRRRPELFMNLLTADLEQNLSRLSIVTSVMGCSESEWSAHQHEVLAGGGSLLDAFTTHYIRQVESAYGRRPFVVPVAGKDGSPVSMIFLVVERDSVWHTLRRESIPHLENWPSARYEAREEWVRRGHPSDRPPPEGQKRRGAPDFSP
jgi:hypothetical protein